MTFFLNDCAEILTIGQEDFDDNTALILAAKQNLDMVELLLEKGADPRHQNKKGVNALMVAATKGRVDITQSIIDHAKKHDYLDTLLSARDTNKRSVLTETAYLGHHAVVSILLDHGAKFNTAMDSSRLPNAVEEGNEIAIEELLFASADPTEKSFLRAVKKGLSPRILDLFLIKGAKIDYEDEDGNTPLICAARLGYFDSVQFLVLRGANIYLRNHSGNSAESMAKQNKHKEIEQYLNFIRKENLDRVIQSLSDLERFYPILPNSDAFSADFFRRLADMAPVFAKNGTNETLVNALDQAANEFRKLATSVGDPQSSRITSEFSVTEEKVTEEKSDDKNDQFQSVNSNKDSALIQNSVFLSNGGASTSPVNGSSDVDKPIISDSPPSP